MTLDQSYVEQTSINITAEWLKIATKNVLIINKYSHHHLRNGQWTSGYDYDPTILPTPEGKKYEPLIIKEYGTLSHIDLLRKDTVWKNQKVKNRKSPLSPSVSNQNNPEPLPFFILLSYT